MWWSDEIRINYDQFKDPSDIYDLVQPVLGLQSLNMYNSSLVT